MTARPRPVPDAVSAAYWAGADRGALTVAHCDACGRAHHPPEPACPRCGADGPRPRVVSGRGTVFAACVVRQAFDAAFADAVPYHLALVAPDDAPEVRILTNLLGADPAEPVAVGTPVAVEFEPATGVGARVDARVGEGDGVALPQFRVVGP